MIAHSPYAPAWLLFSSGLSGPQKGPNIVWDPIYVHEFCAGYLVYNIWPYGGIGH